MDTIELNLTILIEPRKHWWQFWLPKELELDVTARFAYEVENDSIGSYEFWGQKCYDHQPDYIGNVWYDNQVEYDVSALPFFVRRMKNLKLLIEIALENEAERDYVSDKISDSHFDS